MLVRGAEDLAAMALAEAGYRSATTAQSASVVTATIPGTRRIETSMNLTIGCTTRPFANWSFETACEHIAAAGYSDVAVFFDVGIDPDSSLEHTTGVRKTAQDHGLRPSMLIVHADLDKGPDEAATRYKRMVDHAETLGATWLLDAGTDREEYFEPYFAVMEQVVPYAAEKGVSITLKPHGGLTLTADDLLAVFSRVDHSAFGICYDPGNIIYYTKGAERPEAGIKRIAPYVSTAIIKDCIVRDGKPDVLITPGEGWVDFGAVVGGLVGGGFRGPLYVECVGGTTLDEIDGNVRRTRQFVEHILAGLGAP